MMESLVLPKSRGKDLFLFLATKFLERFAYYSFRSILFMYLLNATFKFTEGNASLIYGFFIGSSVVGSVLAALLSDLFLGNKRAMIIGVSLQWTSFILLFFSNLNLFYVGMSLFIIGSSFSSINLLSSFAKYSSNNIKNLENSFLKYFTTINVAAFLGGFFGLTIVSIIGYNATFLLIGGIYLLVLTMTYFLNFSKSGIKNKEFDKKGMFKKRLIYIALLCGICFFILFSEVIYQEKIIENPIYLFDYKIPQTLLISIPETFVFILSIIFIIVWQKSFSSSYEKVIKVLVFILISSLILFTSEFFKLQFTTLFFFLLVTALIEIYFYPLMYSLVIRNFSDKYLTTVLSLVLLIFNLFNVVIFSLPFNIFDYKSIVLLIVVLICLVSILLLIFKKQQINSYFSTKNLE